jgi:hypothetical protein
MAVKLTEKDTILLTKVWQSFDAPPKVSTSNHCFAASLVNSQAY